MKLIFKVDDEGNGYVAAVEPANPGESVGEHRKAATVSKGQELELDLPDVLSADQIGFGNIVDSESGETVEETPGSAEGQQPADTPGGGNEGSSQAGQDQGTTTGGEPDPGTGEPSGSPEGGTPADQTTDPESPGATKGDVPADQGGGAPTGDGTEQGGETPTTSAASEKPLYKVDGDTIPEGFVPSGLETPGDETLYHYEGDTGGQAATGNVDGVSVYADADDNEKPVQPAAPAEGQQETAPTS